MDRVVLGGCFLLVALGVLLGLGVSAEQSTWKGIRNAMEFLSFAGTAVTAVVAIAALTSWQSQFRHTEKFKAMKELREASMELYLFLDYLRAVADKHLELLSSGATAQDYAVAEAEARERWYVALDVYSRAWGLAAVFLTNEEANNFCGPAKLFYERTVEGVLKIATSYTKSLPDNKYIDLLTAADEVTSSAKDLCKKTIVEVEKTLARHAIT